MKLPPNGGLNLSVLDGWWCEAYAQNRKTGWAIGEEIEDGSVEFQNEVDVSSLFHILETQVVPLYYAKPDGRLPLAWLQLMRESIRSITPVFNTHRMVTEYTERLYEPAARGHSILAADGGKKARSLSEWKDVIRAAWPKVRVETVEVDRPGVNVQVGDLLPVRATVFLGSLAPENVTVQAYYGEEFNAEILSPSTTGLVLAAKLDGGSYLYKGSIAAAESGSYGLSVRIIPTHPNLIQAHELRLISWARP